MDLSQTPEINGRITIRSREADSPWMEQTAAARITETEEGLILEYEEQREDGGLVPVRTEVTDTSICVRRGAPLNMDMEFSLGKVTRAVYPTLAGDWELYLHTGRLFRLLKKGKQEVRLFYTLFPDADALSAEVGISHEVRYILETEA